MTRRLYPDHLFAVRGAPLAREVRCAHHINEMELWPLSRACTSWAEVISGRFHSKCPPLYLITACIRATCSTGCKHVSIARISENLTDCMPSGQHKVAKGVDYLAQSAALSRHPSLFCSPLIDMAFPLAEAQLTSLFLQSIAHGIHFATFAMCMCVWHTHGIAHQASGRLLWMAVAIFVFLLCTVDLGFGFYHDVNAFVLYQGPGGPTEAFEELSSWLDVIRVSASCKLRHTKRNSDDPMKSTLFDFQLLFSDATLVPFSPLCYSVTTTLTEDPHRCTVVGQCTHDDLP